MQKRSLEAIVDALNRANVRYLIAGGLAVVALRKGSTDA